VGFKPAEGTAVTTIKFKGEKCIIKETTLEIGKLGELAFVGLAVTRFEGRIKLELNVKAWGVFGV
jgi:hypothetical protein